MALKKNKKTIYTVIDANINRAKEGLRVIEDITRFIFAKKNISKDLKNLRHAADLAVKKISIDYKDMILSRDSEGDVGRRTIVKSEFMRQNTQEILISNFKRVEESMRVLEEISKLIDKKAAARFKDLRYRVYVLEKKAVLGCRLK
jgi:thiamine-phosphate pyrophosphorylase